MLVISTVSLPPCPSDWPAPASAAESSVNKPALVETYKSKSALLAASYDSLTGAATGTVSVGGRKVAKIALV